MVAIPKWADLAATDRSQAVAATNRLLPPLLALLFALLIGWQLASMLLALLPGPSAGDAVPAVAGRPAETGGAASVDEARAIAAAHLFGEAEAGDATPATASTVIGEDLPDTRAPLKLVGTIASADPALAVAIIEDGQNQQNVYQVGDEVTRSIAVELIETHRVVLNENGALTNLLLPKDGNVRGTTNVRRQAAARRASVQTLASADTESIQSVVSQNVSRFAEIIRPTAYQPNGVFEGFRVYPGRNREQFAALGLKPGDIVKEIDGQPLTDVAQAMQIFQQLGDASQMMVTVERDGTQEMLTLSTQQLDFGNEQTQ